MSNNSKTFQVGNATVHVQDDLNGVSMLVNGKLPNNTSIRINQNSSSGPNHSSTNLVIGELGTGTRIEIDKNRKQTSHSVHISSWRVCSQHVQISSLLYFIFFVIKGKQLNKQSLKIFENAKFLPAKMRRNFHISKIDKSLTWTLTG